MRSTAALLGIVGTATALALGGLEVAERSSPQEDVAQESSPTADERAAWQRREADLLQRIAALEAELAVERERRMAREAEWLEFTRAITSLEVTGTPEAPEFARDPGSGDDAGERTARPEEVREQQAVERTRRRAERIRLDLRAHLLAEQVLNLDVLEVGVLHEGWIGPVVIRTLDERGRAVGTLAADRLRLEASRSGHVLTIVLEEGLERVGGRKIPFGPPTTEGGDRGGVRRLHLSGVDPKPWIDSFPELFDGDVLLETPHDGSVEPLQLRFVIDGLLQNESSGGRWRLRQLGGVLDGELRDVQLVELDRSGTVLRRLFADRMRVRRTGGSLELVLSDGVQVRGGRKAPFLQGVYRVFLPDADAAAWEAAGVPGL